MYSRVDVWWQFLGREPSGATVLKRRQMRQLGWRLAWVPYWEWDAQKGSEARAAYLSAKLEAAAAANGLP